MTDCPNADIRDRLPDWVNESLGVGDATDVEAHLARCPACTAEARLLRALRDALRAEPEIDLGRIGSAVVARTLGSAVRTEPRRGWRPLLGGLAIAASLVLGMVLLREASEPPPVASSPMAAVAPDSARPGPATVHAPDDSAPPRDAAGITEPTLRLAEAGLSVGGALADLGDEQLEAFLRRLDAMDALPPTSPAPPLITDFEVR
ncbi:MAG TPA: zf-HC2 domain-containing protein [Gemmatimonadaceae bacterium]|nr:zf-HC2 domain-containing protein [Gemmatimonadaceae bacterium]